MRKIIQVLAVVALVIATPIAAFAHNDGDTKGRGLKLGIFKKISDHRKENEKRSVSLRGTVTAVSTNSFTVLSDSASYTVNTDQAKIENVYGGNILLSALQVNSNVHVTGTRENNSQVITAKRVLVSPPHTHPAKAVGTVTATSSASFTIKTNNSGIIGNLQVQTSSSTVYTKNGATTTAAALTTTSKVKVKGFWDEVTNVFNAIKVKIF